MRAPGTNRDILVAASLGAVAKPLNGWKVSTVSNDAMFDPDRCSTLHPVSVEGTSDLAVFETGIRPDGEGSADANSNWYQLTVTDGKTFRKLTPTPSFNEVAYPATLSSLGNGRVGTCGHRLLRQSARVPRISRLTPRETLPEMLVETILVTDPEGQIEPLL